MTILSAAFRPVSGLKNATPEQKKACVKEKMVSGAKFALAQGALAGVGATGISALVLANDTCTINAIKSNKATKPLKAFSKLGETLMKHKTLTKIGAAAIALTTFALSVADIRKNAKIEAEYQTKIDMANEKTEKETIDETKTEKEEQTKAETKAKEEE